MPGLASRLARWDMAGQGRLGPKSIGVSITLVPFLSTGHTWSDEGKERICTTAIIVTRYLASRPV
jgi:hypothetical protein